MKRAIIPGHWDSKTGYWHDARSSCCKSPVIVYSREATTFIRWHGYEALPIESLRCGLCNQIVKIMAAGGNDA